MKMADIGRKAKDLGIEPAGMKKADLIRAIQRVEGNAECYGQFGSGCPYTDCCFRSDCRRDR